MAAASFTKRGCIVAAALAVLVLSVAFLWPYQAESIEGIVVENHTGCSIAVTSNGGWREEAVAPGITASRVAYPLEVIAFVDGCRGLSDERPYSAELVSSGSGQIVARGLSCAGADHSEGYPCRLEMPPIATLRGQDRYRVRVVRQAGHAPRTADIRLNLEREWRSVVWDALMPV